MMTRRTFAAKAIALFAATAVSTMAVVPAMAGQNVEAPTNITTVGDATLKCSAAPTYNLNFNGHMDMTKVVAKWKELRAVPEGYGQMARFNNLDVWAETPPGAPAGTKFSMSFKIDHPELVTVDTAMLVNHDMWEAAYKAANNNHPFTDSMIVDRTVAPSYDEATGVFVIPMTLKAGLKAEKLDNDYLGANKGTDDAAAADDLKELNIRTPDGLITMSRKNVIDALKENITAINGSEAKVVGRFNVEKPVFGNALANLIIGGMWPEYFPIDFGQAAEEVAAYTLSTTIGGVPMVEIKDVSGVEASEAVKDKAQELVNAATANNAFPELKLNMADRTITNLADLPAISNAPVDVDGGQLIFTDWKPVADALVWSTDDASPICATAAVHAQFTFVKVAKVESPEFTLPNKCEGDVTVKMPEGGKGLTYEKTVNEDKSVTVTAKLMPGYVLPKGTTEADLVWRSDAPQKCPKPEDPKDPKPENPKDPKPEGPKDPKPGTKTPVAPTKPMPEKKKLANTGATVLAVGGASALTLLAGAALVAMRRRNG